MTSYYFEHQKIYLSVDCIIFGFEANKLKVLIGKRQMDPGRGEWSLYGGFVRNDEGIDEAAKRTLYELTGIRNVFMSASFCNVKSSTSLLASICCPVCLHLPSCSVFMRLFMARS